LVGTLFLATAALEASGMAKVAGWSLLIGLPISIFQVAEVGMHTPWTMIVDAWVNPIDEIIQQIVIGATLFTVLRSRTGLILPGVELSSSSIGRDHNPARRVFRTFRQK
jgi:hypothetical protein